MVKLHTSHENAIKEYRELAHMIVIKNVQLFYAICARIVLFDFKKSVMSWATYSAIWSLKMLGFDGFGLLGTSGSD